jgi:glycolate oxidase
VLSLEKMNRILEIDKANLMVTVEPGAITGDIHRAVEAEGLFYPPDPASLDSCTIGGNVAEGAGGPRAVQYGVTKDYVCGLEAVLPSGEIIRAGGKLVKNVTGYNLIQLLVGSEGTLAIVTKIILRLIPLPKVQVDVLVPFEHFQAAADTVSAIIAHRILPTAIEFMERDSILAVERLLKREVPFHDAEAHLLIQLRRPSTPTTRWSANCASSMVRRMGWWPGIDPRAIASGRPAARSSKRCGARAR